MGDAVAVWAVVVAAGSGERLGAEHPPAFVALGDDPLVAASVGALDDHPAVDGIVLVVPEGWEERTTFMCDEIGAGKVAVTVAGGPTRSDSVALGVAEVPDEAALLLVHDAARPVLPAELVDRVLAGFADGPDGVVPALELADTVKRVDAAGRVVETLPRAELRAVQ
ncbi:MAG: 2-C-methyl-D-erythritol 4-phosphate cytidylyltransferase, partial [Actinomycetota bacterium]